MKILITGGAGFIGSHLCEKYVRDGHDVLCLDNYLSGNLWNIRHLLNCRNFNHVKGDVRDKELLGRLMDHVDIVLHLAAQIHVDRSHIEPELTWDINLRGTQNVLEAAKFHSVKRVIFASSSEVYGSAQSAKMDESHCLSPPHPYGASKLAADRLCYSYIQTYGMDIVIMRCFNIFGPRQRDYGYGGVISLFIKKVLNGHPMTIFGKGVQSRDYTYIDDVVCAYDLALRHPNAVGDPINFGTGKAISIQQLALQIGELSGRHYSITYLPKRIGELERLTADAARAKQILGWEPQVSFGEGLKMFIDWYKKYGFEDRLVV